MNQNSLNLQNCFGPVRNSDLEMRSLVSALMLASVFQAGADEALSIPIPSPFKQLRYDEDDMYLRESTLRSDFLDAIKFIPLHADGDRYLTLGGEIRERYEYYQNSLWGRGPQDENGYWLQRYMVHLDAHL